MDKQELILIPILGITHSSLHSESNGVALTHIQWNLLEEETLKFAYRSNV